MEAWQRLELRGSGHWVQWKEMIWSEVAHIIGDGACGPHDLDAGSTGIDITSDSLPIPRVHMHIGFRVD